MPSSKLFINSRIEELHVYMYACICIVYYITTFILINFSHINMWLYDWRIAKSDEQKNCDNYFYLKMKSCRRVHTQN